jgi:hypothetical protein
MARAKFWLILTAVLFVSWIGYLGYLAFNVRKDAEEGGGRPIVLSRPQLLAADLIVTAYVEEGARTDEAKVEQVHWARGGNEVPKAGKVLEIGNLPETRGLDGGGFYILPLVKSGEKYRVAAIPPSPGFPPGAAVADEGPPRAYLSTDSTQAQLQQIVAKLGG